MTAGHKVKVLLVEDSPVWRALLQAIYASDPAIEVVGTAANGEEALALLAHVKPDVVSMDLQMPKMDGLETTRSIMSTQPLPIVIVTSSWSRDQVSATFQAVEAGALALVEKPKGPHDPDHGAMKAALLQTIKAMSEVKVVRRWANRKASVGQQAELMVPKLTPRHIRMVAIGVSTGGPQTLQTIVAGLGPDFGAPIAVVQHIATGFLEGLREWLTQTTGMAVHIGAPGMAPEPGHIYLAPDGAHMGFDSKGILVLSQEPSENGLRPAVSHLFRSAASVFADSAVGIILTGMGTDGAAELKLMKNRGAVTMAQDKGSSIVHGMPGEAIALGAATYVLSPDQMAETLKALVLRPLPLKAPS